MNEFRKVLKAWDEDRYSKDFPESDQEKNLPQPPIQKDYPKEAKVIDLISPEDISVGNIAFKEVIRLRRSHRKYVKDPLTLEELSFLLWCTQGVRKVTQNQVKRTTPSAGGRHPFETYLFINRVTSLEQGLYRYLSLSHKLCYLEYIKDMEALMEKICYKQYSFAVNGAIILCWVAVPYRMEWRHSILSSKFIALEAGHICQNLYLACAAINAGTCAIGFYNQNKVDTLLGIDGENEFTVYVAPVGKIPSL
ncbi:MAG: SagB/ThcOx family dehydrogenase [Candidatus Heimdallarchaeota archaeon]|nr:MAG: SagB/ThcOx family dehydrogenase [Candidatus Heimdallarchaeota archaeon]